MAKKTRDPNIDAALDWLLRLQESPSDKALRAKAEAWRNQDADHARAWKRAERAWQWAAGGSAIEKAPRLAPKGTGRKPAYSRRYALAAMLGLAMTVVAGALVWSGRADYTTATAELRQILLEDGTRIDLSAESAVDISFTASRRTVTLLKGEAFFDVRPDAMRAFDVQAGNLSVTVVGTAFNVRLSPGLTTVAVTEGVVETRYAGQQTPLARLTRGDAVAVGRKDGDVQRMQVSAEDVAPWRNHQIVVHGVPLGEVVADIRRYSGKWIIFDDAAFAGQRVTGVYDLREPDRALRLLVGPFGGTVRDITPFIRVVTGP